MNASRARRSAVSKVLLIGGLLCAIIGVVLSVQAVARHQPAASVPGATVVAVALALVALGLVCRPAAPTDEPKFRGR